jgi:hypothetical protein
MKHPGFPQKAVNRELQMNQTNCGEKKKCGGLVSLVSNLSSWINFKVNEKVLSKLWMLW